MDYDLVAGVFRSTTFRQSLVTFTATLINGGLGALFYFLTARILGPSDFGLFTIVITTLTLVGDIGDLGTDTGLVRFVGKYSKSDSIKAARFLKLGLEVKLLISFTVIVIGLIISPILADKIFLKPELVTPLRIAFVGVGTYLLFTFSVSALQAVQYFVHWGIIQIGTNFFRLLFVLVLVLLGSLTIQNTLLIYIILPFLGFLVSFKLIPLKFTNVSNEKSVFKDAFHFNKWVAVFTFAAALGARLDTFISARLLVASEVGIYSAANQLAQIVPQIVTAVGTVVAPKMATMGKLKELVSYLKKVQIMVLGLAFLGLIAIPLSYLLIPALYGSEYIAAIPVFTILLLAMLVFLISVPIHNSVFYYFSYPRLFFYLSIAHVTLISFLGWNLIGNYGVIGAASTVLIGQVFNFIVPLIWVIRKIRISTNDR